MISSFLQKQIKWLLMIAVPACYLCVVSCENEIQTEKTIKDFSTDLMLLPDSLSKSEARVYINYFKYATLQDLEEAFFYNGITNDSSKVVSFQLNSAQENAFFQRLKSTEEDSTLHTEIRIQMALRSENLSKAVNDEPNLIPLLVLLVNDKPDSVYYPLNPLSTSSPNFGAMYPEQNELNCPVDLACGGNELESIGTNCLDSLIQNWESIQEADISQQLFLNGNDTIPENRIRFYQFDESDSNYILEFRTELKADSKPSFFYLHFGQWVGTDCVPLRTVIHLDDMPLDADKTAMDGDNGNIYFEFAKPCPPYCGRK